MFYPVLSLHSEHRVHSVTSVDRRITIGVLARLFSFLFLGAPGEGYG